MQLRKIELERKGQSGLGVWLFALLFLFMVSLVYIIMTKPFLMVRDKFEANFTGTEFEPTFDKINTYWRVWPIIVITSIFIWAVVQSNRQSPGPPVF